MWSGEKMFSLCLGELFRRGKGRSLLQKQICSPELFGYFDCRILVLETQPGADLVCSLICLKICQWKDYFPSWSLKKAGEKASGEEYSKIEMKNKSIWKKECSPFFPPLPYCFYDEGLDYSLYSFYSFPCWPRLLLLHSCVLQRDCCCRITRSF